MFRRSPLPPDVSADIRAQGIFLMEMDAKLDRILFLLEDSDGEAEEDDA